MGSELSIVLQTSVNAPDCMVQNHQRIVASTRKRRRASGGDGKRGESYTFEDDPMNYVEVRVMAADAAAGFIGGNATSAAGTAAVSRRASLERAGAGGNRVMLLEPSCDTNSMAGVSGDVTGMAARAKGYAELRKALKDPLMAGRVGLAVDASAKLGDKIPAQSGRYAQCVSLILANIILAAEGGVEKETSHYTLPAITLYALDLRACGLDDESGPWLMGDVMARVRRVYRYHVGLRQQQLQKHRQHALFPRTGVQGLSTDAGAAAESDAAFQSGRDVRVTLPVFTKDTRGDLLCCSLQHVLLAENNMEIGGVLKTVNTLLDAVAPKGYAPKGEDWMLLPYLCLIDLQKQDVLPSQIRQYMLEYVPPTRQVVVLLSGTPQDEWKSTKERKELESRPGYQLEQRQRNTNNRNRSRSRSNSSPRGGRRSLSRPREKLDRPEDFQVVFILQDRPTYLETPRSPENDAAPSSVVNREPEPQAEPEPDTDTIDFHEEKATPAREGPKRSAETSADADAEMEELAMEEEEEDEEMDADAHSVTSIAFRVEDPADGSAPPPVAPNPSSTTRRSPARDVGAAAAAAADNDKDAGGGLFQQPVRRSAFLENETEEARKQREDAEAQILAEHQRKRTGSVAEKLRAAEEEERRRGTPPRATTPSQRQAPQQQQRRQSLLDKQRAEEEQECRRRQQQQKQPQQQRRAPPPQQAPSRAEEAALQRQIREEEEEEERRRQEKRRLEDICRHREDGADDETTRLRQLRGDREGRLKHLQAQRQDLHRQQREMYEEQAREQLDAQLARRDRRQQLPQDQQVVVLREGPRKSAATAADKQALEDRLQALFDEEQAIYREYQDVTGEEPPSLRSEQQPQQQRRKPSKPAASRTSTPRRSSRDDDVARSSVENQTEPLAPSRTEEVQQQQQQQRRKDSATTPYETQSYHSEDDAPSPPPPPQQARKQPPVVSSPKKAAKRPATAAQRKQPKQKPPQQPRPQVITLSPPPPTEVTPTAAHGEPEEEEEEAVVSSVSSPERSPLPEARDAADDAAPRTAPAPLAAYDSLHRSGLVSTSSSRSSAAPFVSPMKHEEEEEEEGEEEVADERGSRRPVPVSQPRRLQKPQHHKDPSPSAEAAETPFHDPNMRSLRPTGPRYGPAATASRQPLPTPAALQQYHLDQQDEQEQQKQQQQQQKQQQRRRPSAAGASGGGHTRRSSAADLFPRPVRTPPPPPWDSQDVYLRDPERAQAREAKAQRYRDRRYDDVAPRVDNRWAGGRAGPTPPEDHDPQESLRKRALSPSASARSPQLELRATSPHPGLAGPRNSSANKDNSNGNGTSTAPAEEQPAQRGRSPCRLPVETAASRARRAASQRRRSELEEYERAYAVPHQPRINRSSATPRIDTGAPQQQRRPSSLSTSQSTASLAHARSNVRNNRGTVNALPSKQREESPQPQPVMFDTSAIRASNGNNNNSDAAITSDDTDEVSVNSRGSNGAKAVMPSATPDTARFDAQHRPQSQLMQTPQDSRPFRDDSAGSSSNGRRTIEAPPGWTMPLVNPKLRTQRPSS